MSTSETLKAERELLYPILAELAFETRSKEQLQELMQLTGFDDDVVFAKSLFSDRIAQLHAQHDGHHEKFLASPTIAFASAGTRELLFGVFRMYQERKLGKSGKEEEVGLELPDCKDVDAVIKFQKRMYGLLKNLMPAAGTLNQNFYYPQQQEMHKFPPFGIYPERNYRHFDNDYYPSLPHNPYLPTFPPKPYLYDDKRNNPSPFTRNDPFHRTDSLNRNDSFHRTDSLSRNDSFFDRPSFSKMPSQPPQNKFDQPDFDRGYQSTQDFFMSHMMPMAREEPPQRGFQAVQEEFEGQAPSKKVKRDGVESMKRELELLKKGKSKNQESSEKTPNDPPEDAKAHEATAFIRRGGSEVHEESPTLKDAGTDPRHS